MAGRLEPSESTAIVLRVSLPAGLESLRRRHVADARAGMPAHVTLLYPFATPASMGSEVIDVARSIAGRHDAMLLRLAAVGRWPDTLYASIEPDDAVRHLQAELAAAFPELPVYGGRVPYVPHVTVVEGPGVHDDAVAADPAWLELPVTCAVREAELILRSADGWHVAERFPLRGR